MRLVCPSCGAVCSAEAWGNDGEARQALRIVAELPESVSRRSLNYLGLFRPMNGRGLKWSTALRHLADLERLVRDPFVQWEQRPARPNDSRFWGQAMERLIESPPKKLPLKSHGYLRAIVYEIADDSDRDAERKSIAAGKPLPQQRGETQHPRISADDMRRIREKKGGVIMMTWIALGIGFALGACTVAILFGLSNEICAVANYVRHKRR